MTSTPANYPENRNLMLGSPTSDDEEANYDWKGVFLNAEPFNLIVLSSSSSNAPN